jgi:hypothetical protein
VVGAHHPLTERTSAVPSPDLLPTSAAVFPRRSWNLFGANVNQKLIQSQMDGMVSEFGVKRTPAPCVHIREHRMQSFVL